LHLQYLQLRGFFDFAKALGSSGGSALGDHVVLGPRQAGEEVGLEVDAEVEAASDQREEDGASLAGLGVASAL
jgi:hypothetical protein